MIIDFLILILLVYIAIFTTIYSISNVYKKRKKKATAVNKPMMSMLPLNFENDVQFLHYLIKKKIELLKAYILVPKKVTDSSIAKEEDSERYKLQITTEVYSALSESYKATLYRYFNEESLKTYIAEIVMDEITRELLRMIH